MRRLLTGIAAAAIAVAAFGAAAPAQDAPMPFLPASVNSDAFLEGWFGAEFRAAGLKPIWPEAAMRGYRARYRLLFAGDGTGATIISIDVDEDGSGFVTSTRLRPGKMIEKNGRATYVPGRIMWEDTVEVTASQIGRLRRILDVQNFSERKFRTAVANGDAVACANGASFLIEAHDKRGGYNAIMRDNCDYQEARALIDTIAQLGGSWLRLKIS